MEAKIIKLVDEFKIAINKGSSDGIQKNDKFMIYEKGEELFDPDTNESLGFLEIPKLQMKVFNIQEKMTLLESAETTIETDRKVKRTIKRQSGGGISNAYRLALGDLNDETETIIEEEPKERKIVVSERNIKEGNIARKM
ncbi:MAG: hypothetical protein WC665_04405 [Sulfurimonas sp.]|jgi:hypothetical protein